MYIILTMHTLQANEERPPEYEYLNRRFYTHNTTWPIPFPLKHRPVMLKPRNSQSHPRFRPPRNSVSVERLNCRPPLHSSDALQVMRNMSGANQSSIQMSSAARDDPSLNIPLTLPSAMSNIYL